MSWINRTIAVCTLAVGMTPVIAGGPKARDTSAVELKNLAPLLRGLLGKTQDCPDVSLGTEITCEVEVKITRGLLGGEDSCLAQIPEKIKVKKGKPTRIVWKLVPSGILSIGYGYASYEFEENKGILVLWDNDQQMDTHGWGDGSAVSKYRYFYRHRNSKPNREVVYFPIVLQKKAGLEDSLCAATDPKIVNDGP